MTKYIKIMIIACFVLLSATAVFADNYDYTINYVALTDEGGNFVNHLVEGGKIYAAKITKHTTSSHPAEFLITLYDGELLKDVKKYAFTFSESTVGTSVQKDFLYELDDVGDNYSAKIMVLDTNGNIQPLAVFYKANAQKTTEIAVTADEIYSVPIAVNTSATQFRITFDPKMMSINTAPTGATVTGSTITYTSTATAAIKFQALKSGLTKIKVAELN